MGKVKLDKKNKILKVSKSYEKLSEENSELAQDLDYIIKEEIIDAIKILEKEINKLKGSKKGDKDYISLTFNYDKMKNKI